MNIVRYSLVVALLFMGAAASAAQLGDAAKPLEISAWVKGKPVDLAKEKGKKVVVVEFWATWCPPCRTSIPHLTEMQKKYKKDAIFVGVSMEDKDTVAPFVEKMGDEMDYTVAVDDSGKTSTSYMKAYKEGGIPHAFIVDRDGKVAFHEHPMVPAFESALKKIIAGDFDVTEAARAAELQAALDEKFQEYMRLAGLEEKNADMDALGEDLLKGFSDSPGTLNSFSWNIATNSKVKHRDLELALRAAKLACEVTEFKNASILDTYARVLHDLGKTKQAIKFQEQAVMLSDSDAEKAGLQKTLDSYRGES